MCRAAFGKLLGGQPRLREGDFVRVHERVGRVISYNRDGKAEIGSPEHVAQMCGLYAHYMKTANVGAKRQ